MSCTTWIRPDSSRSRSSATERRRALQPIPRLQHQPLRPILACRHRSGGPCRRLVVRLRSLGRLHVVGEPVTRKSEFREALRHLARRDRFPHWGQHGDGLALAVDREPLAAQAHAVQHLREALRELLFRNRAIHSCLLPPCRHKNRLGILRPWRRCSMSWPIPCGGASWICCASASGRWATWSRRWTSANPASPNICARCVTRAWYGCARTRSADGMACGLSRSWRSTPGFSRTDSCGWSVLMPSNGTLTPYPTPTSDTQRGTRPCRDSLNKSMAGGSYGSRASVLTARRRCGGGEKKVGLGKN